MMLTLSRKRAGWQERSISFIFLDAPAHDCYRVFLFRAKRATPRIPRNTKTAPASPKSKGMRLKGKTGIPSTSKPTSTSDPARIFDDEPTGVGSRRTHARAPQQTKITPSATKAAGRVGNPTRPDM